MTTTRTWRIGTRASTLARTQTGLVADALQTPVEIVPIVTEGDRSAAAVAQLGSTGVFVSALREALLADRIDVAVHSYKDLPTAPADGITIAAVPQREDPRDALVARDGLTLGEIVARGNVIMLGYYNDPDATATAFRGGYFHTGDAAVVHLDGYVEIRDRIKDVIISGGENISSIEVEGVLLRYPAVQEVAVVGMPDERWGEAPYAFVVLKQGANATEDELREFARERMAHFKVPRSFTFVAELPKTATGKIQKYVLRGGRAAIAQQ